MNFKDKSICVVDRGLFPELAQKLGETYGTVYYYSHLVSQFSKSRQCIIGEGLKNVKVICNLWDHIDEVDTFVFPDVGDADIQAELKAQGKFVFGSGEGEQIELDKWEYRNLAKKLGMNMPKTIMVKGVKALRENLKGTKNRYIKIHGDYRGDAESFCHESGDTSEPYLKYLEYNLGPMAEVMEFIIDDAVGDVETGYDGYFINGKFPEIAAYGYEIKDKSYIGKVSKYDMMPKTIQDTNNKLAQAMKKCGYNGAFSSEVRVDKQKKGYLLDPCFSEDTEILTNLGWRFFSDLKGTETVATLNVGTGEIEYHKPYDYIVNDYSGKMIRLSNRGKTIEGLVTPNHGVWRTSRDKSKLFVERADSLTDKGYIPRTGKWTGVEVESFKLPRYDNVWNSGKHNKPIVSKHVESVKIPIDIWLKFLGYYLSEGSQHGGNWSLNISQKTHKEQMFNDLKGLPFNVIKDKHGILIHSAQLSNYAEQFGLCANKFVPDFVKNLSSRLIRIFLDAYALGDGNRHKNQISYATTSKQMADDLSELIFKCGNLPRTSIRAKKGSIFTIFGKDYTRRNDVYFIEESHKQKDYWFETGCRKGLYINEEEYSGKVYDVSVQNHTVYVRRNGKPFWSSNCCRFGNPPGDAMIELFSNWDEIIYQGARGILVNPKPVARYCAMAIIQSEWSDKEFQVIDFPEEDRRWYKFKNVVKMNNKYWIMPLNQGLFEIGSVIGLGSTVDEAIKNVQKRAKNIKGYDVEIKVSALDEAKEVIAEGKKYDINF